MANVDAWEHQQKLNQDPEYQAGIAADKKAMEEKIAEIRILEKEFIEEWAKNGFTPIKNTSNLIQKDYKLNQIMARFILEWIPRMSNKHNSREWLVRSLARSKLKINGEVLMRLFDDPDSSFNLKWAIANTIASAQVEGVNEWIKKKFTALTLGKENEMLIYALAKYFDYAEGAPILRRVIDYYPLQVIDVLSKIGRKEDLEFLKEKIKDFKSVQKAETRKAIIKLSEKYPE